jgi:CMP-N,N'-diacetyllegionaminic acid synthase
MIRAQPLTAIIPVRGGSKGIPGKNMREIGGMSLLERAIKFALKSPRIDRTVVSTDNAAMHALATRHGVQSPTLRPANLATDGATAADVASHVIDECGIASGYLLILQVTAPLRRLEDLDSMCAAFEASRAEASVSLVALDEPRPEKLKRIVEGTVAPYMAESYEGPRQALPQPYRLNGAFYLISLDAFKCERRFVPKGALPFIMPEERSHNLDGMTDWNILEAMVERGHWTLESLD